MKKILAILALAVLLVFAAGCVGNDDNGGTVTPSPSGDAVKDADKIAKAFGSYNGKAIEWRVLSVDKKNEKALLITKDCIALKPFQNEGSSEMPTWENSDMRTWLNGEFYDGSFSESEKFLILETKNQNPANSETGVGGESDTLDKVFLLSEKEVLTYFAEDKDMIASFEGGSEQWWLRTAGSDEGYFVLIYNDVGGIYYPGSYYTSSYGVRPAIWVDVSPEE